jgi:hypothetical protein
MGKRLIIPLNPILLGSPTSHTQDPPSPLGGKELLLEVEVSGAHLQPDGLPGVCSGDCSSRAGPLDR